MDKEKLIQAIMWISVFGLTIFICAVSIYAGFNNVRKANDYTFLTVGIILIPFILNAFSTNSLTLWYSFVDNT